MKYLLFKLSGSFQAWGSPLPGIYRTVEDRPTKSGVVGLIACCLGITREETKSLIKLGNDITLAYRIDAEGDVISDFHIVQNTFLRYRSSPYPGKKLKNIISLRDYLCNAVFTICIQGDDVEKWCEALLYPQHIPYLGRSCCLPDSFLPQVIETSNLLEAFNSYKVDELDPLLIPILHDGDVRVFWEGSDNSITSVRSLWRHDQPNGSRRFRQRQEFSGYMKRGVTHDVP